VKSSERGDIRSERTLRMTVDVAVPKKVLRSEKGRQRYYKQQALMCAVSCCLQGGSRSLHIAAQYGHVAMINKLLDKGEQVDALTNVCFHIC